jgi:hypothetical protein
MGEVIQLQGDQRKDVQEFLTSEDGLDLKSNTIKVGLLLVCRVRARFEADNHAGTWVLDISHAASVRTDRVQKLEQTHLQVSCFR